jgi:hypothetical protein
MLELTPICELTLQTPTSEGRGAYLAAASGLLQVKDYLYVVADDENHLGMFASQQPDKPGTTITLLDGVLSDEYEERKAAKPDFEALILLPAFEQYKHGALLALGSGSKKKRRQGVVLGLDAHGAIQTEPQIVDFSELYDGLKERFAKLNIEGGFVRGATLYLLQRGNKKNSENAVITVSWTEVEQAIIDKVAVPKSALGTIQSYMMGMVGDVPLCFTDATLLPNGSWVFSAAAEATDDNYNDGAFLGGAIGVVNRQGSICLLERIDASHKVEGISAKVDGERLQLLLVTDADDASRPAQLLSATLTGYPWTHCD